MAARVVLEVPNLHCEGCVSSVATVLETFPGIHEIEGYLERCELTVGYDPGSITPQAIATQLKMIGFPVAASHDA